MRLLYLHGPPASGKYTVAVELEELVGASNLHNHLTLDVAGAVFPFGTPQFWELVQELRMVCLKAARKLTDSVVVTTSCYSHPHDEETFREMERIVEDAGGKLLPVFLQCSESELEHRVSDEKRSAMRKLRTVEGLREALDRWNFSPVPRQSCISVSTEGRSARSCAEEIIERLGLERNHQ